MLILVWFNKRKYQNFRRQCYFPDERPLEFHRIYSQNNCERECLAAYILNTFKCVPFYMPSKTKYNIPLSSYSILQIFPKDYHPHQSALPNSSSKSVSFKSTSTKAPWHCMKRPSASACRRARRSATLWIRWKTYLRSTRIPRCWSPTMRKSLRRCDGNRFLAQLISATISADC